MVSPVFESPASSWAAETLFFDGDKFFSEILDAIAKAKTSVVVESYIFENDTLGQKIAAALSSAAARGVTVRIIVDAIGSPGWAGAFGPGLRRAGVKFRIFHRLPWDRPGKERLPKFWQLISLRRLRKLNRRNHRKLIVIDSELAFVGSMNIAAVHLASLSGKNVWRDTSLALTGGDLPLLTMAFERDWMPWAKRFRQKQPAWRSQLVRLNSTRRLRRRNYRDLINRFRNAREKIWITTPYFVPNGAFLDALDGAASRGVDVRLLVPSRSDVFFMPWVAAAFQSGLLHAGARIFQYLPAVLHAKVLIIDDWATVGSSNLNHRSLFHDLEIDIVVSKPENRARLVEQFTRDVGESHEVLKSSWSPKVFLPQMIGKILLLFRYWL